ncbi:maleylpyruvate isomerase N-terminal domain-containing protein [Cellulomonas sp. Leaf395]|uniref:maleylpyruvate isomerase N-terminal domain-containing protein n=1 Tax=Cellulomonas sp. Leaf395 TaxID=1736362 RepID=UPI000A56E394|nr:maleylpyruvate isomerase N-terminal domain-containing protein [Cellulomonas sp. Leaf395]
MTEQTTPVTSWTVLDEAHRALRDAAAAVPSDAWDRPTPCAQWTVAQVLQHAAGDQQGYAATITGEGWPTENPFEPSGHLAGDPVALVEQATRAAALAWSTIPADGPDVTTPLPVGPLAPWVGAGACALDAAGPRLGHRGGDRQAVPADAGARRGAARGRCDFRRAAARVRVRPRPAAGGG